MSSPQPPYGQPYRPPPVYPAYQKPVSSRRRPSGWWFVVAGLLMVAGIAVGVLLIIQSVRAFVEVDATIQADGETHSITVDTDQDRMVWVHPSQTENCSIVDARTGEEVGLDDVSASYSKDVGSGSWEGASTFDPGSGELEITCAASGGEIQIGPAPDIGGFVGGLVGGILLALLLGGAGFVMLIVVAILFATGRPRNVPAPQ